MSASGLDVEVCFGFGECQEKKRKD